MFLVLFLFPLFLPFLHVFPPLFFDTTGFANHVFVVHFLAVEVQDVAVEDEARHVVGVVDAIVAEVGRQRRFFVPEAPVVAEPHAQSEVRGRGTIFQEPSLVFVVEHGVELGHATGQVGGDVHLLHGSGCIAGFGLLAEGHERQQEAERDEGKVGFHGDGFVMVWWMGSFGEILKQLKQLKDNF